VSEFD